MTKRLPKFWHDERGTIKLMMLYPVEGYVLARRTGAAACAIKVTDLREKFKEGKTDETD